MQLSGVYRNCECMGLTQFRFPGLTGIRDIELASDTQSARDAAHDYWIRCGIAGESWLAITCGFAWWYQRHAKLKCLREIKCISHARLEIRVHGQKTRYLQDALSRAQPRADPSAIASESGCSLLVGNGEVFHSHFGIEGSQLCLYRSDRDNASHFAKLSGPLPSLPEFQKITWEPITANMTNQGMNFEKEGSQLIVRNGDNTSGTFAFNEETNEVVKLDLPEDYFLRTGWVRCELHFCI